MTRNLFPFFALTTLLILLCAFSTGASCTLPTITSPAVSSITTTGATITWTTATIANSLVTYGPNDPGTSTGLLDTAGVTSHSVTLTGLLPSQAYAYGIASEAIDTSSGQPCGTGYYYFYNGAGVPGFNTASAPAGSFDYVISPVGPTYITQGHVMYFNIRFRLLLGTYTTNSLTLELTGLPSSFSYLWTDKQLWNTQPDSITTTVITNDTIKFYEVHDAEVQVTAGGAAPTGSYTITATVTGSGLPTHTASYPITVVSSSAPFSGTAFPYSTPTLTGVGYPAIPQLSTYLATANTYGQQNCSQDTTSPGAIRPNDQTHLTPVGASTAYGAWFYDGVQVFYNVEKLLNNGLNWEQCRTNVKQVYRNNYVLNGIVGAETYQMFSHGYYNDYLVAAEPADLATLQYYNTETYAPYQGAYVDVSYLQRETAYVTRNLMEGIALGETGSKYNQTYAFLQNYAMEHVLGMVDQICLSQNAQYYENFMTGLEADSLIQYYNLVSPDPRIPPAIKCLADYQYANQWQGLEVGDFPYDKDQFIRNASNANAAYVGGGNCMVVLDQLISPMYAWLFKMTGSATYQTEGDAIFGYGVQMGTGSVSCGGGISGNFTWPDGNDGKQFSQQYYLGYDYVIWRSEPPVSTVPASGVSF